MVMEVWGVASCSDERGWKRGKTERLQSGESWNGARAVEKKSVTVVSSMIFIEKRRLLQIFPEKVRKLWNEWELRVLVLLSLAIQIILICLASRRKYKPRNWLAIVLWLSYLGADWVATVSLGVLCNSQESCKHNSIDADYVIMAYWAPFLLLHLGGPDNITAYSLEDNELWLRHLLQLGVQVGVAIYVLLRSWSGTELNYLAIPMFVTGIVKYLERTWALMSASSEHFRESLLRPPEPGNDYLEFVDLYFKRRAQGLPTNQVESIEALKPYEADREITPDARIFCNAFYLFKMFKRLYSDLILSSQDREDGRFILQKMEPLDAFKLIEVELGLMFDVLYTKATVVNSFIGILLRCISFSSTVAASVAFILIETHQYSHINVVITYLLLAVAIFLEIYAAVELLLSDWTMLWFFSKQTTMLWLAGHKNQAVHLFHQGISSFRKVVTNKKRSSNSVAQYSLISFCLQDKPRKFRAVQKFLPPLKMLENFQHQNLKDVPPKLKEMIFKTLKEKSNSDQNFSTLCAQRGDGVLRDKNCHDTLSWSVELEFDQSILLWHIATDLCYYTDKSQKDELERQSSKLLSEYMMHLLVKCPFMLPKGIGQIRFRDTYAEAEIYFQKRGFRPKNITEACKKLLDVNTKIAPETVKGGKTKSVFFQACRLAKSLDLLVTEKRWTNQEKWEMITYVWVEMLSYAANHCGWKHHAQQLTRGGELLTHVCLLMAHLGFSEQFQIEGTYITLHA